MQNINEQVRNFINTGFQQDWKLCLEGDNALSVIESNIEDLEDEVAELQCEAVHRGKNEQERQRMIAKLSTGAIFRITQWYSNNLMK